MGDIKPKLWIIADGPITSLTQLIPDPSLADAPARAYQLSDLGRYLIQPGPIEVANRLVGCQVQFRSSTLKRWMHGFKRFFKKVPSDLEPGLVQWTAAHGSTVPPMQDATLEHHLQHIEDQLRVFDPVVGQLNNLDLDKVLAIHGLCEDLGGHHTTLQIDGTLARKLDYIRDNLGQEVVTRLAGAYLSEGLFDLRGFDFKSYQPARTCQLVRASLNGEERLWLGDTVGKRYSQITQTHLLPCLQVLEHALKANPTLAEALSLCLDGRADAWRLMVNRQLTVDYTKAMPPPVYREVFANCRLSSGAKSTVINLLNQNQLGISFNFIPHTDTGERKIITTLSVLHDIRALEPLRATQPDVYRLINERAFASELGRFYLLEAIKGYQRES